MTPPMPPRATAYTDMRDAIEHTLGTPEYAAADGDRAAASEMIALAVCAALAERRTVYIPLPATIRGERQRAARDAGIVSMFDHHIPLGRIVQHSGLSRRQVLRILRRRGRHVP